MKPNVSIIVLTYNQRESIGDALDSLLAQKCGFPFEIVVGDDCSTDGTREICREYGRRYPEVIRLMPEAPNKGIVDNYFDCFEACRGRYVADCAGDDVWPDSNRLRLQHDFLDSNPGFVAVMSDWTIVSDGVTSSSLELVRFACYRKDVDGPAMLKGVLATQDNLPLLSAMMYRREVLSDSYRTDRAMIRNRDWNCEDLPLLAALAAKGAFGYLPLNALEYRVADSGVSNSLKASRQFDFYAGPADAVITLGQFYGVDASELKPAMDRRIKYLAGMASAALTADRYSRLKEIIKRCPTGAPLKAVIRMILMRIRLLFRVRC